MKSSMIMLPTWLMLLATLAPLMLASNPDEITSLPGLSTQLHFKQYSGYLNSTGTKKLHYWFVESEKDPSSDPLLLWLNGGPGCSSLFGLLRENGPFQINDDGETIFVNPYRWNKEANVLYLEAPAGVGFSYSDDHNYTTDDDKVADDNYAALQDFFSNYPQFKANDFYVTGESYAGIYVPTLSVRVLTGPADINFKGFAIGNGLTNSNLNIVSLIFFAYHHGLIGEVMWDKLAKFCCHNNVSRDNCKFYNPDNPHCQTALDDVSNFVQDLNLDLYNLYAPCVPTEANTNSRYTADYRLTFSGMSSSLREVRQILPCMNDTRLSTWLNMPETRRALHIPDQVQRWKECSPTVAEGYTSIHHSMKPFFEQLLASGRVRGLVYNGDVDLACNFMGGQWFVEDLGLKVLTPWRHWSHLGQIAGFYKTFENLSYMTIKGSGHMVPQDKPGEALAMISSFLSGEI